MSERAEENSSAVTEGIRVSVRSQYVADQSVPLAQRYVFAYTVRIANEGAEPAQLRTRHWIITDGAGKVEEVRGPGVVGQTPYLRPGSTSSIPAAACSRHRAAKCAAPTRCTVPTGGCSTRRSLPSFSHFRTRSTDRRCDAGDAGDAGDAAE